MRQRRVGNDRPPPLPPKPPRLSLQRGIVREDQDVIGTTTTTRSNVKVGGVNDVPRRGGVASVGGASSDGLLATACRNVSLSNRSLVLSVVRDRQRVGEEDVPLRRRIGCRGGAPKGDASLDQRAVTLQPASSRDCTVYAAEGPARPSLLQRSKTFVLDRAQSVRARANSVSSKTTPRGISLVFENKDENGNENKGLQRRSSFRLFRKRS